MPFKIVQTIEDGQICLSVVPALWEENGVLYWPKNKALVSRLQKNELSKPDTQKWEKMMCHKKRDYDSYSEAEKEMMRMEEMEDTDVDEAAASSAACSSANKLRKISRNKQMTSGLFDIPDFNKFIMPMSVGNLNGACSQSNEGSSKVVVLQNDITPAKNTAYDDDILNRQYIVIEEDNGTVTDASNNNNTNNSVDFNNSKQLVTVIENQNKIITQQAKMQASLDSLVTLLSDYFTNESTRTKTKECENELNLDILFKPIKTEEELKEIEEKLKTKQFASSVIKQMTYICGTNGKANGTDCAYKLIDYFISRDVIAKCSWTGNSRQKGEGSNKIPLKFYTNFRTCFLNIIRLADSSFSEIECEKFFKTIIKNSQPRKQATIQSAHKRRPRNLKYKKPVPNDSTEIEHDPLEIDETSNKENKDTTNADEESAYENTNWEDSN